MNGSARRPRLRRPGGFLASLAPLAILLGGLAAGAVPAAAGTALPGLEVETVEHGTAGDEAGLAPGDRLIAWTLLPAAAGTPARQGELARPADWTALLTEEVPRGTVLLAGWRGAAPALWTLPRAASARWGEVGVRPPLPALLAALSAAARERLAGGDAAAAAQALDLAAELARRARRAPWEIAWLEGRWAGALARAKKPAEAEAAYGVALATAGGDPRFAAQLLREWGDVRLAAQDAAGAADRYGRALDLDRRRGAEGLAAAADWTGLGNAASRRGDTREAAAHFGRARALFERLAPLSFDAAENLKDSGVELGRQGDLDAAEQCFRGALAIQEQVRPGSLEVAKLLNNLGVLAGQRGALADEESLYRRSLALKEALGRTGPEIASTLANLGLVAKNRGDLAAAETYLRRALALHEGDGDDSKVAIDRLNLGVLALHRKDLDGAEEHFARALALRDRHGDRGPERIKVLDNLAMVEVERGHYDRALEWNRQALELAEAQAPGGLPVAAALTNRAAIEGQWGHYAAAAELFERARSLYREKAPGSLLAAVNLHDLGTIAMRQGDLARAEELVKQALELQERLAPGGWGEAQALFKLGWIETKAGRLAEGTNRLCRSLDLYDRFRAQVGGSLEEHADFGSQVMVAYVSCAEALLGLGRDEAAVAALERARAQSFLGLLAERDLRIAELPAALADRRRKLAADTDRTEAALARASLAGDADQVGRGKERIAELRRLQEELGEEIRRTSGRFATLASPQPVGLAGARAALDSGTLLLSYATADESTLLIAVRPRAEGGAGLAWFSLPIGAAELKGRVQQFLRLVEDPEADEAEIRRQGAALYGLLIAPAEGWVDGAARLLISPDGSLGSLPWAALVRRGRYLPFSKPLHITLSATVYAELRKRRPASPAAARKLVAFGDPVYPAAAGSAAGAPGDAGVADAVRRGLSLAPLPESRREIEALAARFRPEDRRIYLGAEATEERVKAISGPVGILHFATHGLLDPRFPLSSALALSLPAAPAPGRDNGLLQAWEIFEGLRVDADLVTLSACDTARGAETTGEGMIGLTRAFQYAGARSVLASLWSIADRSTARLMDRFYGYLQRGVPKDQALARAQTDLARDPATAAPYHWAAFQLSGDWR